MLVPTPLFRAITCLFALFVFGLPAPAQADDSGPTIPAQWHGQYKSKDSLDSIFAGKDVRGQGPRLVEVKQSSIDMDHYQDSTVYQLHEITGDGATRKLKLQAEYWEEGKVEWTLSKAGQIHTLTLDKGATYQRLADISPALVNLESDAIDSAALFSRGWYIAPNEAWIFVGLYHGDGHGGGFFWSNEKDTKHPLLLRGDTSLTFHGGIGFNETLHFPISPGKNLDDYGMDRKGGRLELWQAHMDDGPDPYPVEGGNTFSLKRMQDPPFVVLADTLNLRAQPKAGATKVGSIANLQSVAVWARTKSTQKVGAVEGEWLLVQKGSTIGWGFGPFVGRRLEPIAKADAGDAWLVTAATEQNRPKFGWAIHPQKGARCMIEAGSKVITTPADLQGEAAGMVLIDINKDKTLDPICWIRRAADMTLCPFLSTSEGDFQLAGCGKHDSAQLPPLSGKDNNGDGHPDLIIGKGESARVVPFQADKGVFFIDAKIASVDEDEGETTKGEAGNAGGSAPTVTQRESAKKGCGCQSAQPLNSSTPALVLGVFLPMIMCRVRQN